MCLWSVIRLPWVSMVERVDMEMVEVQLHYDISELQSRKIRSVNSYLNLGSGRLTLAIF